MRRSKEGTFQITKTNCKCLDIFIWTMLCRYNNSKLDAKFGCIFKHSIMSIIQHLIDEWKPMKSTHNCSRQTASSVSPDLLCPLLGGQAVWCQSRGCLWAYCFARHHHTHPSIPAVHLLSYFLKIITIKRNYMVRKNKQDPRWRPDEVQSKGFLNAIVRT